MYLNFFGRVALLVFMIGGCSSLLAQSNSESQDGAVKCSDL